MGVFIYGVKLGGVLHDTPFKDESIERKFENEDKNYVFVSEKENGWMTKFKPSYYEVVGKSENDVAITYSSYDDFLVQLNRVLNDGDYDVYPIFAFGVFSEVFNVGIENMFDYSIAENMLKDFMEYNEKAMSIMDEHDYGIYHTYMKMLEYVVENKGIVIVK